MLTARLSRSNLSAKVPAEVASELKDRGQSAAGRLAELERRVDELSVELEAEKARSERVECDAVRRERQRITQALHDTVCQSLGGLCMEAAVLSKKLEAQQSQCAEGGKVLREMLHHAAHELRELVRSLQDNVEEPGAR